VFDVFDFRHDGVMKSFKTASRVGGE